MKSKSTNPGNKPKHEPKEVDTLLSTWPMFTTVEKQHATSLFRKKMWSSILMRSMHNFPQYFLTAGTKAWMNNQANTGHATCRHKMHRAWTKITLIISWKPRRGDATEGFHTMLTNVGILSNTYGTLEMIIRTSLKLILLSTYFLENHF